MEEPAASIFRVEEQNSAAVDSSETLVNIYQTTQRYMTLKKCNFIRGTYLRPCFEFQPIRKLRHYHYSCLFSDILVPATEHGYFVASGCRTPLHHPPKVTRFYFQQTSNIHAPVGKIKRCSLSGRSPAPIADSFHVATMARKQRVKFTRN
jgi:hypothetical protein